MNVQERLTVWHHSCTRDGQGEEEPCNPPCDDPWSVQTPSGWSWIDWDKGVGTFATLAEAMDFAVEVCADPEAKMRRITDADVWGGTS